MTEQIKLSVLDVEKKYHYEYDETTYGTQNIVSYGADNNAPALFNNCYKNSATLKSIIDGSVNYILGDEVIVNDEAASMREQVNRKGMTMRHFIGQLALSYQKFGGFAFQVIYNKLGVVCELYPLDFARCRTNEYGTKIWYSKKAWTKYATKADEYDAFNPTKVNMENPTQIFYFKGDFSTNVYPLPPYYGAIKDVLTEIEASNYSLNSVSNGFAAKYIINFPEVDNLTDEQKRGIENAIKNKFCGTEAESNFMLYWQGSDGQKLDIQKLESDETNERYIAIRNAARENIYTSMRCTPNLMGLPTATTGFNSQEYSAAFKLYNKTVIQPIQESICGAINKVLGKKDAVTITPFAIEFDE